jgi:hypothetical protein
MAIAVDIEIGISGTHVTPGTEGSRT